MGVTRTGTTGGSGARGSKRPIAGAEDIIAQCRGLKGVRAVKIVKENFQFLPLYKAAPKNASIREKNKGPHSGPKYGVINGGFPLIYDSFTGQIQAKIWAKTSF
jgi:hypothetical protein